MALHVRSQAELHTALVCNVSLCDRDQGMSLRTDRMNQEFQKVYDLLRIDTTGELLGRNPPESSIIFAMGASSRVQLIGWHVRCGTS